MKDLRDLKDLTMHDVKPIISDESSRLEGSDLWGRGFGPSGIRGEGTSRFRDFVARDFRAKNMTA